MNNIFTKLSLKDQMAFTTRLAFLISADVPILESLKMIRRQTRSKSRAKIVDAIIEDISSGHYLSDSLGKFKNIFGDFAVNIIRVGEEAGILDKNLEYLAEELKKRAELKKKIVGAMIYPAFVTAANLGISGLISVYVFPKIIPVFKSLGVHLPLTTRILIGMTTFISQYWVFLVGGGAILLFLLTLSYKKIKIFRYGASKALLATPIFGRLAQSYHMANLCRTMGLLLNCHINIVKAADITANATSDPVYKKEITVLALEIAKGKKISQHLDASPRLFPEMIPQMVSVGETTGRLGDTLVYLGNYYESEVNDITKNLSNSIEPALLAFMGLIVGFVAVSVITPIYEITQNLH